MDQVTQQNSALVEENAATAKTLDEQARAMGEQVAFFRIADDTGHQGTRAAASGRTPQPRQKVTPRPQSAPAAKTPPRQRAVAKGGPVGRMHAAPATAIATDEDWKKF